MEATVKDIDAIEGLLENLEVLALAGIKIAEDGIGSEDIATAVGLLSNVSELLGNFKKAGEAFKEAKDIDSEEAVALIGKIYSIGKKVEEALRK